MRKNIFVVSFLSSLFLFACSEDAIKLHSDDCQDDTCEQKPDPTTPGCGNGVIDEGEACDEGDNKTGGCAPDCKTVTPGWICAYEGAACQKTCGNGVIDEGEACDEGKNKTGGCAPDCKTVTPGWICVNEGEACDKETCGNGVIDEGEACDEGEYKTGGCTPDCTAVKDGWMCPEFGMACYTDACGNGTVDADVNEMCDEGENNLPLDMEYGDKGDCFENCTWLPYCGDAKTDALYEQCDRGKDNIDAYSEDARNGYGFCTKQCRWSRYYCGDGQITNDESCDDGNYADGDGCSATCQKEPGFYCPTPGQPCEPFKCGNKTIDPGETCDDGNRVDGDGCSAACQTEPGYICITTGEACEPITCDSPSGTSCDDGNRVDGDGCSATCLIEPGWICPDKIHCYVAKCGDGIAAGNEECDDGNAQPKDGCSPFCKIEDGYVCPKAGGKCHLSVCGDGIVEGDEKCDEGQIDHPENQTAGCVNCTIQLGWECLTDGASCTQTATCGNAKIEGAETCDEGELPENQTAGCVNCTIQPSWRCPEPGKPCIQGKCGDGFLDMGEQCDDGNLIAGDGCDPACKHELIFECSKTGSCRPVCGDGVTMWMLPDDVREECDDGNTVSGDGCSADCKIENGWKCTEFSDEHTQDYIDLPVTYYDFRHRFNSGTGDGYVTQSFIDDLIKMDPYCNRSDFGQITPGVGHPDFQWYACGNHEGGLGQLCKGMVEPTLDDDGKPKLIATKPGDYVCIGNTATKRMSDHITCSGAFHYWYRSTPGLNRTIQSHLRLFKCPGCPSAGSYRFDSAVPCSDFACKEGSTWALTEAGEPMPKGNFVPLNKSGYCSDPAENCGNSNFTVPNAGNFTTEIKTYFQYKGGETLTFRGNDDVWVFINNKLFVDIGGMHQAVARENTLSKSEFGDTGRTHDPLFDVYEGGIYSVAVFNAERCMAGSDFQLTLAGFVNAGSATCASTCGDGIVVGPEECDIAGHIDDETARAAGCVNCIKTAYCPNGIREGTEECDGEEWCNEFCKFTDSRCGDGTKGGHEQCDDGSNNGKPGSSCAINCTILGCGNGILESGEACDDGNTINDDHCSNACTRPKCGDSIVQAWLGEVCDDGINDGSYNGCGLGCTYLPPRCGDAVLQTDEGEECDLGTARNTGAYGLCTPDCKRAPHCGDGIHQPEFEDCDDGSENGQPGKCPFSCVHIIY